MAKKRRDNNASARPFRGLMPFLNELDVKAFADNGRYVLALRLGQTSQLSATLNAASGDAFDTDDADSQVDFIRKHHTAATMTAVWYDSNKDGGLKMTTR